MHAVNKYLRFLSWSQKMVLTAQTNHRSVQTFTAWHFRKYPGITNQDKPLRVKESESIKMTY